MIIDESVVDFLYNRIYFFRRHKLSPILLTCLHLVYGKMFFLIRHLGLMVSEEKNFLHNIIYNFGYYMPNITNCNWKWLVFFSFDTIKPRCLMRKNIFPYTRWSQISRIGESLCLLKNIFCYRENQLQIHKSNRMRNLHAFMIIDVNVAFYLNAWSNNQTLGVISRHLS